MATVEEINTPDSDELIEANETTIFPSRYGTYGFGPEPGGSYTPKLPGQLLLEGGYHQDVDVMFAHNAHEAGGAFPRVKSEENIRKVIMDNLAGISATDVDSVLQLYPPPPNSQLYTTQEARAETIFSEVRCFPHAILAMLERHTLIVGTIVFKQSKATMPHISSGHSLTGIHLTSRSRPTWPKYSVGAEVILFRPTIAGTARAGMANERCEFSQKGAYMQIQARI